MLTATARGQQARSSRSAALLVDQRGDTLQLRAGEQVFEPRREAAPPVRVRVAGTGQVGLLLLAGDVFELNQHQPRPRPGEKREDRVAEGGAVGRGLFAGQELAEALV